MPFSVRFWGRDRCWPTRVRDPSGFPVSAFLAHWWIFPASILFSAIALSAGVSGALFFSPFFILAVELQPAQAIGAGLLTEVFGMGNGLLNYVRQGVVDYATAKWLLLGALPAVVLGALGAHYVPTTVLKGIFGGWLILLGAYLVYQDPPEEHEQGEKLGPADEPDSAREMTTLETRDGTVYTYETCWRIPGVSLSALGGTIGTRFGKYVSSELMEPALGVVFSLVGVIVLWTGFFV